MNMKTGNILLLGALGLGAYFLLNGKSASALGGGVADVGSTSGSGYSGGQNTVTYIYDRTPQGETGSQIKTLTSMDFAAGTPRGQSLPTTSTPNTFYPNIGIGYNEKGQGYSAMKPMKSVTSSSSKSVAPVTSQTNTGWAAVLKSQFVSKKPVGFR